MPVRANTMATEMTTFDNRTFSTLLEWNDCSWWAGARKLAGPTLRILSHLGFGGLKRLAKKHDRVLPFVVEQEIEHAVFVHVGGRESLGIKHLLIETQFRAGVDERTVAGVAQIPI